jgi:hypothetical protein
VTGERAAGKAASSGPAPVCFRINRSFIFVAAGSNPGSVSGKIMTVLDEGAQKAAQGVGLEKAGIWLMAAYWLAMLAIMGVGALAGGS